MPYALLIVGLMLIITGVKNTQDDLFTLVQGDFSGSNSFVYWVFAILLIGAVGYVPGFKPISNAFLLLVLLALLLHNSQDNPSAFFQKISAALSQSGTASIQPSNAPQQASNSGGFDLGSSIQQAATAAALFG